MRQRVWSADVYCQSVNNLVSQALILFIRNGKKGKRVQLLERQRERQRVAENGGSVGCKNGRQRNRPFWDKPGSRWTDYLIAGKLF